MDRRVFSTALKAETTFKTISGLLVHAYYLVRYYLNILREVVLDFLLGHGPIGILSEVIWQMKVCISVYLKFLSFVGRGKQCY